MNILSIRKILLAIGLSIFGPCIAMADPGMLAAGCGNPFDNGAIGPWDYQSSYDREHHLPIIERYHFNREVETLVKGQTSVYILQDLDYVLRAFPGHHRALASLLRYAPNRLPDEKKYLPTECYFQRAIVFAKNDATAFLVYGVYLASNDKALEAKKLYLAALELNRDYAEAHYNLGLLYVKEKEFELAVESAKKAYELGFPLQGLKRQLEEAGVWGGK
jgi:tetratricopeptide (TPR) repeat protein